MESSFGQINVRDIIHGLITTVIGSIMSAVVVALNHTLSSGQPFAFTKQDGMLILAGAVISGVSYLQKKLLSDEQGNPLGIKIK